MRLMNYTKLYGLLGEAKIELNVKVMHGINSHEISEKVIKCECFIRINSLITTNAFELCILAHSVGFLFVCFE